MSLTFSHVFFNSSPGPTQTQNPKDQDPFPPQPHVKLNLLLAPRINVMLRKIVLMQHVID